MVVRPTNSRQAKDIPLEIRYSIFLLLRQERLGQQVKISRRRKHSDYFRQVRCSIFDFDLFHSEHLGRALNLSRIDEYDFKTVT